MISESTLSESALTEKLDALLHDPDSITPAKTKELLSLIKPSHTTDTAITSKANSLRLFSFFIEHYKTLLSPDYSKISDKHKPEKIHALSRATSDNFEEIRKIINIFTLQPTETTEAKLIITYTVFLLCIHAYNKAKIEDNCTSTDPHHYETKSNEGNNKHKKTKFTLKKFEDFTHECGIYIIKCSLCVNTKLGTTLAHSILSNDSFAQITVSNVDNDLKSLESLTSSKILNYETLLNAIPSTLISNKSAATIFSSVSFFFIFYKAEHFRKLRKQLQDLLIDKKTNFSLLSPLKNSYKKVLRFIGLKNNTADATNNFEMIKTEKQSIDALQKQIHETITSIDALLLNKDVKRHLLDQYEITDDMKHNEEILHKILPNAGTLTFHRTGSTSIILKYTVENTKYALKLVKKRFWNENKITTATAEARKNNAKIEGAVKIISSKKYYLIMNFVEGSTVTEYILENIETDENIYRIKTSTIIQNVINKLDNLHRANLYHMDLSRDNIIIDHTGSVNFIDYGQNYVLNDVASASQYADIANSVAPELISDNNKEIIDYKWSDLYSFGVLLLELYNKRISKNHNDLATLLDYAWERSPAIAYISELLIDGNINNRINICNILNTKSFLLKNIFNKNIDVNNKIVVEIKPTENSSDSLNSPVCSLYEFLSTNISYLFRKGVTAHKNDGADEDFLNKIPLAKPFLSAWGFLTGTFKYAASMFVHALFEFIYILRYLISFKNSWRHSFIHGYFGLFQKLSYAGFATIWIVAICIFSTLYLDHFSKPEFLTNMYVKLQIAYYDFLKFIPSQISQHYAQASINPFLNKFQIANINPTASIKSYYDSHAGFILKFYTGGNWDTVLSAIIVGTSFAVCATFYYKNIFSKITVLDFATTSSIGKPSNELNIFHKLSCLFFSIVSEVFVRSTSFILYIPIIIGLYYPKYWATCSWIGVIPVTINSIIHTVYLEKTYKTYTDKQIFSLPISNAVSETVKKFSTWYCLLLAYILVLLVGDFGLRGNILQDWIMYSFLVFVVNIIKMLVFNCCIEGRGVQATIYRCYAASLRLKIIQNLAG